MVHSISTSHVPYFRLRYKDGLSVPHPHNKIGDGPEGPEAATVADKLRNKLQHRIIMNAIKDERGKSIGFENLRVPTTIIDVKSYGKKIIIYLSIEHAIIISLGMSGRLQYQKGNHSHIYFEIGEVHKIGIFNVMNPSFSLFFDDSRYMGGVDVIPYLGLNMYFMNLGPDLLQRALNRDTWISLDEWIKIFNPTKYSRRAICDVLLKQEFVAGIGNYLKSEILYYAGVLPDRSLSTITMEEWDKIRIKSHEVIVISYSYGGFTIESFISPDGEWGRYPAAVYGKKFDPMGNPVISDKTRDGRTSHWVPAIQK